MEIAELVVPDAYRVVPAKLSDERGCFYEAFRREEFAAASGHPFAVAQVNYSISRRNTIRGIHGVRTPPGQAKYVTCLRGAVLDMIVDLRVDSPTLGSYAVNRLDSESGVALYIAEGLGHAFQALTDDTCMSYLCSTPYVPGTPFEVNPLDPDLALPWLPLGEPILSAKDRRAPTLAEAAKAGILAGYQDCLDLYSLMRCGG